MKNEMPSGSVIVASDIVSECNAASATFKFATAKLAYLKIASSVKLPPPPSESQRRRVSAFGRLRACVRRAS